MCVGFCWLFLLLLYSNWFVVVFRFVCVSCVCVQMCPSVRRGDQEFVFVDEQADGAVRPQPAGRPGVVVRLLPAAHLGVSPRGGGPHAGRGRRTQILALKRRALNTLKRPPPRIETLPPPPLLTPSSSSLQTDVRVSHACSS